MAKNNSPELSNLKSKISNRKSLRALIVEDSEDDTLLIIRELKKGGYNPEYERVETSAAMKKTLHDKQWDIILCDYKMPKFSGEKAIVLLKETNIDIPLIIVSGTIGEETAVECMRSGAQDYIMKDNLSRLCPSIARELKEAEVRAQRKQVEPQIKVALAELQESEEKFSNLFAQAPLSIQILDISGKTIKVNRAFEDLWGVPFEQMVDYNIFEDDQFKNIGIRSYLEKAFSGESVEFPPVEFIPRTKSAIGHKRMVQATAYPIKDKSGTIRQVTLIHQDITESKQAEEKLRRSEEKYRSLVENSQEGIFQSTAEGSHITVNQTFANILGYDSPEEVLATISNIPRQIYVNPDDRAKVLQLIEKEGLVKGYEAEFYKKDGSRTWVSINMHAVRDNEGNLLYYQGINQDIMEKKNIENERQQNVARLRKSLQATINAMVSTVEARDPYTAGHQLRVSNLARSIAVEMNLERDQIDSIRMAAAIHDIGKITLPAEILTKPTKLTDLEFSLIKTHSLFGYDILKDIEFPWPVADIVLKHHERMNGSGYPQGLKGENIPLEARILGVADVTEAITSHRPYRAALGIDFALEEISRNKGILYDEDVADACIRLFREKGYTLSHIS